MNNMQEMYDQFPINILETGGEITRESIGFMVRMIKVWENGRCIIDQRIDGVIKGKVIDHEMHIELRSIDFSQYILSSFEFSEISLNRDRILWSNDFLNGGYSPAKNIPAFLSLFYEMGSLSKVQFSNHTYLIEFYGSSNGYDIYEQIMNSLGL